MTKIYRKTATIKAEQFDGTKQNADQLGLFKYRDIWDAMHYPFRSDKMDKYMEDNSEIFARAWLDGFQTED